MQKQKIKLAQVISDKQKNYLALKSCKKLHQVFRKCKKNNPDVDRIITILKYLDKFIDDEKARGLLMDRIADIIIYVGNSRFSPNYQDINYIKKHNYSIIIKE